MSNEIKKAKARYGYGTGRIIVDDCPYCHKTHYHIGNKQYKHKSNQVADESEIAVLRSEIANYETARQEDGKRLEQVTAEREAYRKGYEAAQLFAETLPREDRVNYFIGGHDVIYSLINYAAALKGGKG